MTTVNEQTIRNVVQEVLSQLTKSKSLGGDSSKSRNGDWGVFKTVDEIGRAHV